MSQPLWQKLKNLFSLDQKIKGLQEKITNCEQEIAQNETDRQKAETLMHEHKATIDTLRKNVKEHEFKIAELDEQEKKKKETLDQIKNQKTYNAIKKELETLAISRQDYEDRLMTTWHEVETEEKKVNEEKEHYNKLVTNVENKTKELSDQIQTIRTELATIEQQQQSILKDMPADWSSRYQNMKGKIKNPIIPVLEESCGACFYLILPQDLARIKKGAILPCRNCYRLLYYDQETEEDSHSASY